MTRVAVTKADTVKFIESAFRNIELPPLSSEDIEDIRDGLEQFARHRSTPDRPMTITPPRYRARNGGQ